MDEKEPTPFLIRARGHDAGPGSVSEIHLKHLLALNLRKLQGAEHCFVPRSYILFPGDFLKDEFNSFVLDFKISQAAALVKHVAGGEVEQTGSDITGGLSPPEGLWGRELPTIHWEPGPEANQPLSNEMVDVALSILERTMASLNGAAQPCISDVEWIQIRSFDTRNSLKDVSEAQIERCRSCMKRLVLEMPELQVPLLNRNFWALKPSCGQFGRGILLMDRLPEDPEELLHWAAAVGRGGLKGGNDVKEGCVLQKLIEQPQLLDKNLLGNCDSAHSPKDLGKFKYNLRMIVLATLRSPCRIWLYREGFVSLALCPFTSQLDPLSHITNLRQGAGYESQRRWPLQDLDSCLREGGSSFDESFRPQVKRIISSLFYALSLYPTSLLPLHPCDETLGRSAAGKKLRRFGFDFLIDRTETVWLLEVNFLKNGYAIGHAQSGPAGDAKRDFVHDFMAEETLLRTAVAAEPGAELPPSFEELQPGPIVGLADCAPSAGDGKPKSPYGPGGIYHEKQVGSLCALHCVNNLLQKPAYDDGLFRMIAMELDRAERSLLGGDNLDFGNARMDGFYNVQVMQEVLRRGNSRSGVPPLEMMPISSEAAKECKIDRVKETAFILNKNEHWFSLRRIGAEWFDLNSCLPNPAHYTPGDLDFHIRDAVREGYSVFVVRGAFPKCELEEEHNHKKLLEAVQGCGRPRQTYSLFAGGGQAPAAGTAASPASNDAAALRAARLARFGGGGGPAPAPAEAAPAAALAAPAAPAAAPAAPAAPAAVPQGNPALEQLVSMGFDREQSKNALEAAKGNVEQAAELLLSM